MPRQHSWPVNMPFVMRAVQEYYKPCVRSPVMILSFVLSLLARKPAFSWMPELDLSDNEVRSTLIPGVQY